MSAAMDKLIAEVAETRSAVDSVKLAIAGIAQQIRDNAADQAKIMALANDLDTMQSEIGEAVTSITPPPPPPPPPPDQV